jgi:hypothetical protein
MKMLALVPFVAAALAFAPAALADACSPLDCAPSQFSLDHGRLLATRATATSPIRVLDLRTGATVRRLPAGVVERGILVHQSGDVETWFDLATGRVRKQLIVRDPLTAVAQTVGASQDGARAVLESDASWKSTFLIVGQGPERRLVFRSAHPWAFDALSGNRLYLIHYLRRGYEIRVYDLAAHHLRARPLKDPNGSSTIWGTAFARLASPDGRYLYTLYIAPDGGSMIHQLDLRNALAHCIDLPGDGSVNAAWTTSLALSPDGRTLWAVSPGYGRASAIDVGAHRVRDVIRFAHGVTGSNAIAGTAPDGRIAATDGSVIWLVEPRRHRVVDVGLRPARALGFGADGRLWAIGLNAAVYSLVV